MTKRQLQRSILEPTPDGLRTEPDEVSQFAKRQPLLLAQHGDVTNAASCIAGHAVRLEVRNAVNFWDRIAPSKGANEIIVG